MDKYPLVGDVRGQGLMLGVDLVEDRGSKAPATTACAWVVRRMRDLGVHVSIDGPFENVIKIKPPMCFSKRDAETLYSAVDQAVGEWVKGGLVDGGRRAGERKSRQYTP